MISMNRMSAVLASLTQTIFGVMFLLAESAIKSELGARGQSFSICLMFVDFFQVAALVPCLSRFRPLR